MSTKDFGKYRSVVDAAQAYTDGGLALVPLRPSSKTPCKSEWNIEAHCIQTPRDAEEYWSRHPNHGIGLAHAFSEPPTWALDIDNTIKTREYFNKLDLNLDQLLDDSSAIRISSGQENREKLIYRLPPTLGSFSSFTHTDSNGQTVFEVRCATKDGKTVQDVLPPSVHPTTKIAYQWRFEGSFAIPETPSQLLETLELSQSDNCNSTSQPLSISRLSLYERDKISSALKAIPPDIEYDDWLGIGMALHSTGDYATALKLFDSWSSEGSKYKAGEPEEKFHSFSPVCNGVSLGTLFYWAEKHGWDPQGCAEDFRRGALNWTESDIRREIYSFAQFKDEHPMLADKVEKRWQSDETIDRKVFRAQEKRARKRREETETVAASEQVNQLVREMNEKHAVVSHGGSVVIVNKETDLAHGGCQYTFSKEGEFKLLYKNRLTKTQSNSGKLIEAAMGDVWLKHPDRKQYDGIVFSPGKDHPGYLNLFSGWAIDPEEGDIGYFLNFIKTVICNGNVEVFHYLTNWLSHLFQKPDELPEVAIALRGGQGCGKNFFVDTIGSLLGSHYIAVTDMRQLTGNFNSHLMNKLLVFGNEAVWSGDKSAHGVLKSLVTDKQMAYEAKFKEAVFLDNFKRTIVASNEDWVVPVDWDDRRWLVLDVSNCHQQDHSYFRNLAEQLKHGGKSSLLHHLLNHQIGDFEPRRKPQTGAAFDVRLQSADPLDRWVFDVLNEGEIEALDEPPLSPFGPLKENEPTRVGSGKLYSVYTRVLASGRRQNLVKSKSQFYKRFSELTGATPCRLSSDGEKLRAWDIPPLATARAHYEEAVGEVRIQWRESEASQDHTDQW